jgi:hypothetical protein
MIQVEDSDHQIPHDPAGKHRKSLEHGSSIAAGNCSGFFPVDSYELPVFSGRNRSVIIVKNLKNFRQEYCFHKINEIAWNQLFPGRFVRPRKLAIRQMHIGSKYYLYSLM